MPSSKVNKISSSYSAIFFLNFCTGEPVEEGGKYQIKPDGSLIIRNLDFSDMGNYACLVKNDFGSDKIETFVYPVAVSE